MENNLKNGYYLSIYSEIDPILNIKEYSLRHDHNMTLFKKEEDGVSIVQHWEFERISGLKHHQVAFYNEEEAIEFINGLLSEYSLKLEDMCEIFGTPQLSTCFDYHSINDYSEVSYHSVSHLFTSMLMDTEKFYNENIIAFAFDGGPDAVLDKAVFKKKSYCGAVSLKGKIEIFPVPSPGPYWLHLSRIFNKPEGTLMALAYATSARYIGEKLLLIDNIDTLDVHENMKILRDFTDNIMSYPKSRISEICDNYDDRFTEYENKLSMITKIVQEISISNVNKTIQNILEQYHLNANDTYVALSGGYALNCPTNTNVMNHFNFKGQLICPCVNDSGMAIGMGLYYFFKKCGAFKFSLDTAFLGCKDNNLHAVLENYKYYIKDVYEGIDRASDDILNEPIVWFDGRSEIGPRALGHRSILANPGNKESKDLLNRYKQREWWRPVAPIILESEVGEWFSKSFSSPYMLNNFVIKSNKKNKVESIIHLDDTARVQTITVNDNKTLFSVIKDIYCKTKIPIICNTSLNDKGEPIINTIPEAFNFALRKGIRVIYINGTRVKLYNHDKYRDAAPLKRNTDIFLKRKDDDLLMSMHNPYNLSLTEIIIKKFNMELEEYSIKNENDINQLKRIIHKIRKTNNIYDDLFELIIL